MDDDNFDGMTGVDTRIAQLPSLLTRQAIAIKETEGLVRKKEDIIKSLSEEIDRIRKDRTDKLILLGISCGMMFLSMGYGLLMAKLGSPWIGALSAMVLCVVAIPVNLTIVSGGNAAELLKSAALIFSFRKSSNISESK